MRAGAIQSGIESLSDEFADVAYRLCVVVCKHAFLRHAAARGFEGVLLFGESLKENASASLAEGPVVVSACLDFDRAHDGVEQCMVGDAEYFGSWEAEAELVVVRQRSGHVALWFDVANRVEALRIRKRANFNYVVADELGMFLIYGAGAAFLEYGSFGHEKPVVAIDRGQPACELRYPLRLLEDRAVKVWSLHDWCGSIFGCCRLCSACW
eukprot:6642072-Prymnesium_polylepis.1